MKIAVPRETETGERRVALTPDSVGRLVRAGHEVRVERGAGEAADLPDAAYEQAGATIAKTIPATYAGAELVVKVQPPTVAQVAELPTEAVLISLVPLPAAEPTVAALTERGIRTLALERVPRISRAQSMDVLSSQSTVAGYKAVLLGAGAMSKFLPMLTTAAGTIAPARVFVIGAGVAGLQAIATARRLGAVVSAFDIRPAAAEQVASLGASFLSEDTVTDAAEVAGGYARAQTEDEQERTLRLIAGHLPEQDLIITTAQIPGRAAPRLITTEMVRGMHPGAVIVDLAAETGGNCEATRAGETIRVNGVTVIGPVNLPSTVPLHASSMFSRNIESVVRHLAPDGTLHLDPADEITGAMLVTG